MEQNKIEAESGDMLDFRDWMDGQIGEDYNESALKGYGWKWQGEEPDGSDGVHAKLSRWTMTDRGVPYILGVRYTKFNETVISYTLRRDTPETPKAEPGKAYRITFRSELIIRADSEEEAEDIFAGLDLYSDEALKYGANWVETNSIDKVEEN